MKRRFLFFITNLFMAVTALAQVPCPQAVTIDGETYPVVKIGSQCWTSQNMRHSHYADGMLITPGGKIYNAQDGTTLDPSVYGLLYTAQAATRNRETDAAGNMQGICPDGWHIPSTAEMELLMTLYEAEDLMAAEAWLPRGGTNVSGFDMMPAGSYNASTQSFEGAHLFGAFWTTKPATLVYHQCQFGSACSFYEVLPGDTAFAISVRCVRDIPAGNPAGICFSALEDGATVGKTGNNLAPDLLYSTDGGVTWKNWADSSYMTITLAHTGDKVYFKAGETGNNTFNNKFRFTTTREMKVSGNIMRLLNDTITNLTAGTNDNCFYGLFSNTSITDASELELPAVILTPNCYYGMFRFCDQLTEGPALPADSLASGCYQEMFRSCYNLNNCPELPAMKLADNCYREMFRSCYNLTTAPALPATTLKPWCYVSMFFMDTNFTSTSRLVNAPALPATELAVRCYANMFWSCTGLTTAPALPATTLAPECYHQMFFNCVSLTDAPALSADTLAARCYNNMFTDCKKLSDVTMLATDISASDCLSDWLKNAGTDVSVTTRTVHVVCGMVDAVKTTVPSSPDWQTGVQAPAGCISLGVSLKPMSKTDGAW